MIFPKQFTSPEINLLLPGPAGLLEVAVMDKAAEVQNNHLIAVIAHPHPLHGGTMQNKVVTTLARSFRDLGMVSVRFNYRGVGKSEGSYGAVSGECEDTLAIANWTQEHNTQAELILCGFSFGAFCALASSLSIKPRVLISIAPAIEHMPYHKMPVPPCPWLIVQGSADEVVSIDATRTFVSKTEPKPTFIELPEVGHFFHQQLPLLRSTVVNYLNTIIAPK